MAEFRLKIGITVCSLMQRACFPRVSFCHTYSFIPQSWSGKSLSQLDLRGQYNLNILGFRDYENAPLDVQFGPNDLLKTDTYIMAVINNQYLDYLARLND